MSAFPLLLVEELTRRRGRSAMEAGRFFANPPILCADASGSLIGCLRPFDAADRIGCERILKLERKRKESRALRIEIAERMLSPVIDAVADVPRLGQPKLDGSKRAPPKEAARV